MSAIIKKLPFVVCYMFVSILTPNLRASQLHISEEVIAKIVLNENHCVHAYEDDKIYLNHGNIYPTENGLFLDLNGIESIPLSTLSADSKGCWISKTWEYPVPIKCPECGKGYYYGKCKNPNCPKNKK